MNYDIRITLAHVSILEIALMGFQSEGFIIFILFYFFMKNKNKSFNAINVISAYTIIYT